MKLIIALLTFTSVAAFLPPHAGRKSVAVSHHGHDEEHGITFKDSNPVLADVFNAVEALFSAPTPVNDPSAPEVASNPVFADVANAVEALFSAPTPVNDRTAPEVAVVGGFGKSMANAAFGVEALASATTAGRATRNAPVAQSPLGHSLADAFFGTFKGNDYPDLGFPTGFSGEPHKRTLDAWSYKLDFSKDKAQAKVQPTVVRPRRGSAFPAAVPTEELLSDLVDSAASSPLDAYMANEIKRAYAGSGANDYPELDKATGYSGTVNRNKGQRSD